MDIVSWVVIGAAVWALASIPVAVAMGRMIGRADCRARDEYAESDVVPTAWLDEFADH